MLGVGVVEHLQLMAPGFPTRPECHVLIRRDVELEVEGFERHREMRAQFVDARFGHVADEVQRDMQPLRPRAARRSGPLPCGRGRKQALDFPRLGPQREEQPVTLAPFHVLSVPMFPLRLRPGSRAGFLQLRCNTPRNAISTDFALSMVRFGLPMSNVAVASCGPRENNSAGFGARLIYCPVRLTTRS